MCVLDLFTLAEMIRQDENSSELEGSYQENLIIHEPILKKCAVNLNNPRLLSKKILRKHRLMPSAVDSLVAINITRFAPETLKVFPNIDKNPYQFYKYFSNYTHGNPLAGSTHGNEIFWILNKLSSLTSQMIELVNITTLADKFREDLLAWHGKLQSNRPFILAAWIKSSEQINNQIDRKPTQ